MRIDPLLVAALAAVLGCVAPGAPLAVALGVGATAWVLGRRLSAGGCAVAAVALALGAARSATATRAFAERLEATRVALGPPSRCFGVGTVESSPVRRSGAYGFVFAFDSLECEGRALAPYRARLYGAPGDAGRGDRYELVTQLATVELFRNAELPDPTPPAARADVTVSGSILAATAVSRGSGLARAVDRARARARSRIDATFVPLAAPLARALVLGESDLTEDDGEAFRRSGLSHLLAVSGTHLVFAVLGVVRALEALLRRVERLAGSLDVARASAAFGAVLAPLYADFAGGSGSARRAAFMLALGLGARALGRRPDAGRSFALSIALGAALDPLVGYDVSFLLSVAATGGLLSLGRALSAALVGRRQNVLVRASAASLAATLSAMAPCVPLLATLGPTLTVAGIFANVLAAPFGEIVALPLCLAHALVVFEPLERGIGLVASGALLVVRALARGSAAATWLAIPVPPPGAFHCVVLGVGVLGAWSVTPLTPSARARRAAANTQDAHSMGTTRALRGAWVAGTVLSLAVVERAAIRAGAPTDSLRVTVLDVGQGDSTLVDLPDGSLLLVDGGGFVGSPVNPGNRVILPLLRARRRDHVDVAVLSHPHPDHYLGLATTLAVTSTGELWDTGQGQAQGAGPEYHAMLRDLAARSVPVRLPATLCDAPRRFGAATVTVLSPCPAFDPALGANDNSLVLRVRLGARAVLLVGDAEHEAEERLLAAGVDLRADLLKAGHHGSRTSTSAAWLDAIHPEAATLSCGVRNRFGHPHPLTLGTLARAGVPALRTDLYGSVTFWTDGLETRFAAFADPTTPPRFW